MRTFLYLLASLIASLILGALTSYLAVETLPCRWFGTGFEGACAYGVLWTAIGLGLASSILLLAYLCYRVLRRASS